LTFFFIVVLGAHCGIYKGSYNILNISYLNSSPPSFSFIPSSIHSWNSFSRSHFSIYIHVYTVCAPYSPYYTFSSHPAPHTGTNFPDRTCSDLLFSNLVKEKKWNFCLFKIAIHRVPLWHFQVYMYHNPNFFISSIFLLSTLVPFLWQLQQI
jgi:hypothetical protein